MGSRRDIVRKEDPASHGHRSGISPRPRLASALIRRTFSITPREGEMLFFANPKDLGLGGIIEKLSWPIREDPIAIRTTKARPR
jgi:hypothetical protein